MDNDVRPLPPVRDFPDASIRWLLQSPANVRGLLLAVAPTVADRLDYTLLRPIPRTFIHDSFREREADTVFHARYRPLDGSAQRDVWVYLLLEHQSDPDPLLSFRLLYYMVHLWEMERRDQEERRVPDGQQRLSPMLPIVVYTGMRPWERLGSLADLCDVLQELAGFLPRYDSVFFNVGRAPAEALRAQGDPVGELLRLFHDQAAPASLFSGDVEEATRQFLEMKRGGQAERAWQLTWFLVGFIRNRRPSDEQDLLLDILRREMQDDEMRREVDIMAKTFAEDQVERGKAIGKTDAKRETLLEQMRLKFGSLPPEVEARVAEMTDLTKLNDLLRLVLKAASLAEMGM